MTGLKRWLARRGVWPMWGCARCGGLFWTEAGEWKHRSTCPDGSKSFRIAPGDHVETTYKLKDDKGRVTPSGRWEEGDCIRIRTNRWGYDVLVGHWVGAAYLVWWFDIDDVRVLPPRTPEEQVAWDRAWLPGMEGPAKAFIAAERGNCERSGEEWTESLTRGRAVR